MTLDETMGWMGPSAPSVPVSWVAPVLAASPAAPASELGLSTPASSPSVGSPTAVGAVAPQATISTHDKFPIHPTHPFIRDLSDSPGDVRPTQSPSSQSAKDAVSGTLKV